MKIEVLGTGCTNCNIAEAVVRDAVAQSGIPVDVVKISNRLEIARSGVPMTPAVLVNGNIKLVGRIPRVEDVLAWINEYRG